MVSGIGSSQSGTDGISQMWQKLLKKADTDQDGQVSSDELKSAAEQSGDTSSSDLDELFSLLDSNTDGYVSESEFSSVVKDVGGPEGPGGAGGPPPPMKPEEMFKTADADEDGSITLDELKSAMSQGPAIGETELEDLFNKLDEDEDGSITESEFTSGMSKIHEEMQAKQEAQKSESSSSTVQNLIQQLPASEGYDQTGESTRKLLQSLFSITA